MLRRETMLSERAKWLSSKSLRVGQTSSDLTADILRVVTRAGHGTGKPIGEAIDEIAVHWTFTARWPGLKVTAAG